MATAEDNLWTRVIGDDWRWSFTTTDDVSGWATPLVQIRTGTTSDATLVATSTTAEGVTANVTVASNFGAGTLSWHVTVTVTETLSPGTYWLELSVMIDGDVTTVLTHVLSAVDQVAVEV
jgi:hypothetical protein